MDDIFVNIEFMKQFIGFRAVLVRPLFEIDVMKHADRLPKLDAVRIIFFRKDPHDLGYNLCVLNMERFLVILFYEFFCLFRRGNIAHSCHLLIVFQSL